MTSQREPAARDVYFPVEVASREYSGHLVLGVALALRGFTATIGYKGAVTRAMESALLPGVVFYKHSRMPRWAHLAARAVGQDPEGGFTATAFRDFFAERTDLQKVDNADAYFCYGKDDFVFLRESLPAANVCLTGSPRVMLWAEAGKLFYADQIAQIRARYKKFILIASSGARGNPGYVRADREGRLDDERRAILERDDLVAQEMLRAAHHLAQHQQRQVVIRPHPAEDLNIWRKAIADAPGITLETCFDLAAWIHAADAVIHRTSTAGMEAAVASVPAISYAESEEQLKNDIVAHSTATPDKVSVRAIGLDALLSEVERVTGNPESGRVSEQSREILEAKFRYPLAEAPKRICDELESLGPWVPASGLSKDWRRNRLIRFQSLRRDDERVGVVDRPLGSKRRPFLPRRVDTDVRNALRLLGVDGAVRVRFRERDCFTLF